MPGHLGSARSGEDVALSPAAILGHLLPEAVMGRIVNAIRKALGTVAGRPRPRPSGPARPEV